MEIKKSIFKAYDIRGIYDKELSVEIVELIINALCSIYKEGNNKVIIGRDGRLSSIALSKAVENQFLKCNRNVINIGMVPTPLTYFATEHLKLNSCIMITGSHNPKNYNGLKIIMNGHALAGKEIEDIYDEILCNKFSKVEYINSNSKKINIENQYIEKIQENIKIKKKIKVAVDGGNGVAGPLAIKVYKKLGIDVEDLYCDVDGNFPNHSPNPSDPNNLKDLIFHVKKNKCDLGLAFDGDGDRCLIIDNNGNIQWPDKQMMLYSKSILRNRKNSKIVYDIKSTKNLDSFIKKYGGQPILSRTGHSFIKKRMKDENAVLGGEMSGHIFFKDKWYGFDDGIYTGARMIELLSNEAISSSELFNKLPQSFFTPEININVYKDGIQHDFMKKFSKKANFPGAKIVKIDGLRADYENGWGLIRASNTTSCLVMRFEAETEEQLIVIKKNFIKEILKIDSTLEIPDG